MEEGELANKSKHKKVFGLLVLGFLFLNFYPSFSQETQGTMHKDVYFFWGIGCPHCYTVKDSGILEEADSLGHVDVYLLEVYYNQSNRDMYNELVNELNIPSYQRGIPLLVINCSLGYSYYVGDTPIITNLMQAVNDCEPMVEVDYSRTSGEKPDSQELTLIAIVAASLIDSINPCAFGVLIFLMSTLLSMGSAKKALKYGMIYIVMIFLVYFSVGLGIMRFLVEFSTITEYFMIFAAALALIGGIVEIKDFFWYGKGFSLRIPVSAKPLLTKITKKGTLPAVILLGIVVALVELPCTGGIYLAILSLMHMNRAFGIPYLVLYNFIFVLPLIIMVLVAYYGTKTEKLQKKVEGGKKWMRLAAGILMIGLAFYLLNSVYGWI